MKSPVIYSASRFNDHLEPVKQGLLRVFKTKNLKKTKVFMKDVVNFLVKLIFKYLHHDN